MADSVARSIETSLTKSTRTDTLKKRPPSKRAARAHVMQEKPEDARGATSFSRRIRQAARQVQTGDAAALPPMPEDCRETAWGFAQWLLRPDHPLTARVTVNRFWQEVFGTGIVRTAAISASRRTAVASGAARLAGRSSSANRAGT